MVRRLAALAAVLVVGLTAPSARALPAPPGPVAVITASVYTFWPGDDRWPELELHVTQGQTLVFDNLGTEAPHSVREDPSDGVVLFDSGKPTDVGEPPSVVAGVEALVPGRYAFVCRVHPDIMQGTLIVDPA